MKILFLVCFLPLYLFAQAIHMEIDNDLIVSSDEKYTGGFHFTFMGDAYESEEDTLYSDYVETLRSTFSLLPWSDFHGKVLHGSVGIQQITITPGDINESEPIYDDIPYSGLLGAHLSLFASDANSFEQYRLSFGVIGKYALSKEIQNSIHKATGSKKAKGWKNQIGDYYALSLGFTRGVRIYEKEFARNYTFELFYSYFADLGTSYIGAGGGTLMRIGKNVPKNIDVPTPLFNHAPNKLLNLYNRPQNFGYSLDLGISANGIGYYYLYSESRKQGYDFSQPRLLITSKIALSLYKDNMSVALELFPVFTRDQNPESTSWGRFSFGWHY